jgi:hypothetical protein
MIADRVALSAVGAKSARGRGGAVRWVGAQRPGTRSARRLRLIVIAGPQQLRNYQNVVVTDLSSPIAPQGLTA